MVLCKEIGKQAREAEKTCSCRGGTILLSDSASPPSFGKAQCHHPSHTLPDPPPDDCRCLQMWPVMDVDSDAGGKIDQMTVLEHIKFHCGLGGWIFCLPWRIKQSRSWHFLWFIYLVSQQTWSEQPAGTKCRSGSGLQRCICLALGSLGSSSSPRQTLQQQGQPQGGEDSGIGGRSGQGEQQWLSGARGPRTGLRLIFQEQRFELSLDVCTKWQPARKGRRVPQSHSLLISMFFLISCFWGLSSHL